VTLRRRLVLAFAYLLVLTVVALAIPLGVIVDRRAKDAFYNRITTQAQAIASSLGGTPIPGGSLSKLRHSVTVDGNQTDARIIVTNGSDQARLLADSDDKDATPPNVPYNTPGRPEIRTALTGQSIRLIRHSVDLGGDLLVVAYPVFSDGRVVGTVRLSQPMADVDARVRVRGNAEPRDIERHFTGGEVDRRDESLTRVHAADGNTTQEMRRSM